MWFHILAAFGMLIASPFQMSSGIDLLLGPPSEDNTGNAIWFALCETFSLSPACALIARLRPSTPTPPHGYLVLPRAHSHTDTLTHAPHNHTYIIHFPS